MASPEQRSNALRLPARPLPSWFACFATVCAVCLSFMHERMFACVQQRRRGRETDTQRAFFASTVCPCCVGFRTSWLECVPPAASFNARWSPFSLRKKYIVASSASLNIFGPSYLSSPFVFTLAPSSSHPPPFVALLRRTEKKRLGTSAVSAPPLQTCLSSSERREQFAQSLR